MKCNNNKYNTAEISFERTWSFNATNCVENHKKWILRNHSRTEPKCRDAIETTTTTYESEANHKRFKGTYPLIHIGYAVNRHSSTRAWCSFKIYSRSNEYNILCQHFILLLFLQYLLNTTSLTVLAVIEI